MFKTIQVTHKNGDVHHKGIYSEESEHIDNDGHAAILAYPTATVEAVLIHGVVPCWHCGEPIVITEAFKALKACQSVDQRLCHDCQNEELRVAEETLRMKTII